MTINRLNQGTTNQVLVKAISGQTTNLLELQDSSGNVVSSIGPTGALGGTISQPQGLVLIKQQTIGSAVSSVNVTNAFSAAYDNYLIQVSGGSSSTTTRLTLQIGATTSGYFDQYVYTSWNNTIASDSSSGNINFRYAGSAEADGLHMNVFLSSPFLSKTTRMSTNGVGQLTSFVGFSNGLLNNTTSYTDFTIIAASGTITGGIINVYGYRK